MAGLRVGAAELSSSSHGQSFSSRGQSYSSHSFTLAPVPALRREEQRRSSGSGLGGAVEEGGRGRVAESTEESMEESGRAAVHKRPPSFYRAAAFSAAARHERKIGFRLLAENYGELAALPFPASLLHLGCRSGELSKLASCLPTVQRVLAVEGAQEMVAVAETFNGDARVRYEAADDRGLARSAGRGEWDVVLALDSDAVLGDPLGTLGAAWEWLRPGGLLLGYAAADPDDRWEDWRRRAGERWAQRPWDAVAAAFRREGPWALVPEPQQLFGQVLDKVGFDVLRCTLEQDELIQSAAEGRERLAMETGLSELADQDRLDDLLDALAPPTPSHPSLPPGHFVNVQLIVSFLARKPL